MVADNLYGCTSVVVAGRSRSGTMGFEDTFYVHPMFIWYMFVSLLVRLCTVLVQVRSSWSKLDHHKLCRGSPAG